MRSALFLIGADIGKRSVQLLSCWSLGLPVLAMTLGSPRSPFGLRTFYLVPAINLTSAPLKRVTYCSNGDDALSVAITKALMVAIASPYEKIGNRSAVMQDRCCNTRRKKSDVRSWMAPSPADGTGRELYRVSAPQIATAAMFVMRLRRTAAELASR